MAATVVLTPDLIQGTVTSAPLPWPAGATTATAAGLLSGADAADPSKVLGGFGVQLSFDGGLNFPVGVKYGWAGGLLDKDEKPSLPSMQQSWPAGPGSPTHARVVVEAPAPISVGATLEFA